MAPKKIFSNISWMLANLHRLGIKDQYVLEVLCYVGRNKGLKGLLGILFNIIRSKLFGRCLLVFGLSDSDLEKLPQIEIQNYQVVSISSSDMIDETLREQLIRYKYHFIREPEGMMRKGAHFWIGYYYGQFAHFSCTRTGDKVDSYIFSIPANCILIEDSVTIPKYRGHDFYPATLVHIVSTLRSKGFNCFYITCNECNVSSVRGIYHAGFNLIARVRYKRDGRLVWYQESPDFTRLNRRKKVR
jgi:hypothetical protein